MAKKGPKRHYISESILRRIADPSLFELNKESGAIEQRSPNTAGQIPDYWPQSVEDDLSIHDNLAGRIFQKKIKNQHQINLDDSERRAFALWLICFFTRSPKRQDDIRGFATPMLHAELLKELRENKPDTIKNLIDHYPARYRQLLVAHNNVGEAQEWLFNWYLDFASKSKPKPPDPAEVQQRIIVSPNRNKHAEIIMAMDWIWLHSEERFVISDDPIAVFDPISKNVRYGMVLPGAEITMPLSKNLTLLITKAHGYNYHSIVCDAIMTRHYNCRQFQRAHKYVWGGSKAALDFTTNIVM